MTGTYSVSLKSPWPHGFVRSPHGTVTKFDPRGSVNTNSAATNAKGVIAGTYESDMMTFHSFFRKSDGSIAEFDPPRARGSFATASTTRAPLPPSPAPHARGPVVWNAEMVLGRDWSFAHPLHAPPQSRQRPCNSRTARSSSKHALCAQPATRLLKAGSKISSALPQSSQIENIASAP